MQEAFGTVLWVVCGVGVVVAFVFLVQSGKTWEEYRDRGMVMDRDASPRRGHGPAAAAAERDAEIREMLNARNQRRIRRGEAPIDVEQELTRLTMTPPPPLEGATGIDAELRAEIRQLVLARNHRRIRAGKPPLDVEAEIEREISDFGEGLR